MEEIFLLKNFLMILIDIKKDFERNHPDEEWKPTGSNTNSYITTRLKLPYDDEFSLFYSGEINNFDLNLKYAKRKSKDEIIGKTASKLGYNEKRRLG